MTTLLIHPTGNRNVRAVLSGLDDAGLLAEFYTTIATNPDSYWLSLLPARIKKELLRRVYPLTSSRIKTRTFLESMRILLPRVGMRKFTQYENSFAGIDAVYKSLDKYTSSKLKRISATQNLSAVYAYEDGALETFIKARELGLKCVYDLPIAYWETSRKLLNEEKDRLPQWSNTLAGGVEDSIEKLERKSRELELADLVITPSHFVLKSIPEWAKDKRKVLAPFGSPKSTEFYPDSEMRPLLNSPLRVLFVGSMGQRKGLGDLFSAFRQLKSRYVELIVMGSLLDEMKFYRREFSSFIYEPGRAHGDVLKLMRSCDVLCLPSIVEGRALVMQEAMSQGLPLIITENTGGADLIIEGETGFMVPIRSPFSIAEKVNWFIENKAAIPAMKLRVMRHAAQYTWTDYGNRISDAVKLITQA